MRSFCIKIFIGLTLLSCSCSGGDKSVSIISRNGHELLVMNMKSIKDSTVIYLTDIASDLRFIQLETLPECLISSATYYVTDKYILAKTKTAIFQFAHNGKFIRILATRGQGPREFSAAEWVIDDKNERLILADEQKSDYFLYFDLNTGNFIGNIPKAIPGFTRKFVLTSYGSLACVPYTIPGDNQGPFYLYWQDLAGKLIDTIRGPAGLVIFRGNYLAKIPAGYRYMLAYSNRDTIYTLRDKSLIPYLAFNHGEEIPDNMEDEGYRNIKIAIETEQRLFFSKLQITKSVKSGNNTSVTWNSSDYLLDKIQKKGYFIKGIFDDYMGSMQPVQTFNILPNNLIVHPLQALEVIGIAEHAIQDPKSGQKLISRMKQLLEQVGRDDNPLLLVGKIN